MDDKRQITLTFAIRILSRFYQFNFFMKRKRVDASLSLIFTLILMSPFLIIIGRMISVFKTSDSKPKLSKRADVFDNHGHFQRAM